MMVSEEKGISDNKTKIILGLSEDLIQIYQATIAILEEGIKAGKTNMGLGVMCFIAYIDMLHGGAYSGRVEDLPYYSGQNRPPINLPIGAKPEQIEALENSNAPHVFPKLLSDQAYFLLKEWGSLFMTETLLKGASTSVSTLVEAGTSGAARVLKGISASRGGVSIQAQGEGTTT